MLDDEPVDILVVEDNPSERETIVETLECSMRNLRVVAVGECEEALDFLFARGRWTDRAEEPPPRLILLDLSLLGSDGLTVLDRIRSLDTHDMLTLTPVVILTDSQSADNITRSYCCGANSYILKPLSSADFQAVVETVGRYWLKHNKRSA